MKADVAANTKFRSDLNSESRVKSEDCEKRQGVRAGDVEALTEAIIAGHHNNATTTYYLLKKKLFRENARYVLLEACFCEL